MRAATRGQCCVCGPGWLVSRCDGLGGPRCGLRGWGGADGAYGTWAVARMVADAAPGGLSLAAGKQMRAVQQSLVGATAISRLMSPPLSFFVWVVGSTGLGLLSFLSFSKALFACRLSMP